MIRLEPIYDHNIPEEWGPFTIAPSDDSELQTDICDDVMVYCGWSGKT